MRAARCLASLATVAAASPALNVTLTKRGATTVVRVAGAGLRLEATLKVDDALFRKRYREVHIEGGKTLIKRQGPPVARHHAGLAQGAADGEVFGEGRATASIDRGRLQALVIRLPTKHVELHYEDGVYQRVHAPEEAYQWETRKTFERTTNLRRELAANECLGGQNGNSAPVKYISVVAFNDASRYARRGTDVEMHTAAIGLIR